MVPTYLSRSPPRPTLNTRDYPAHRYSPGFQSPGPESLARQAPTLKNSVLELGFNPPDSWLVSSPLPSNRPELESSFDAPAPQPHSHHPTSCFTEKETDPRGRVLWSWEKGPQSGLVRTGIPVPLTPYMGLSLHHFVL